MTISFYGNINTCAYNIYTYIHIYMFQLLAMAHIRTARNNKNLCPSCKELTWLMSRDLLGWWSIENLQQKGRCKTNKCHFDSEHHLPPTIFCCPTAKHPVRIGSQNWLFVIFTYPKMGSMQLEPYYWIPHIVGSHDITSKSDLKKNCTTTMCQECVSHMIVSQNNSHNTLVH